MSRDRAWRRTQRDRYRAKTERLVKDIWGYDELLSSEDIAIQIQGLEKNRAKCSRACCGNQRKWTGEKTVQEKRFSLEEGD